MSTWRVIALVAALAAAGSCSSSSPSSPSSPAPSSPAPSPAASSTPPEPSSPPSLGAPPGPVTPSAVEEIVTGLAAPWSIAFVPGGSGEALVTLRDEGTIVLVDDTGAVTPVGPVPGVDGTGEGGLLGLAFDPASPSDLYVYATMGSQNVVQRTVYSAGSLGPFSVVLDGIPAGTRHDGGRLAFGPDGMLYISTGESGNPDDAQDLDSLGGKILRITPGGDVPADNPIDGSPIWSYGHRNVEGLAFDDAGRLWASEFGDREADEVNLISPGHNYGWPFVEGIAGDPDYVDPVVEWRPTSESSPSGLAYVRDTLFVAALRGERLWQVPLTADGAAAGAPAAFVTDYGRLRDAVVAPDGTLWVLTNNTDSRGDPRSGDDRILRLTLAP
ncbi:PQQ-dependent sugar dehydrogenase [Jiangella anatolica]|uniref:Glucose sorbosone dehydrogenase n=1 Tax=Jiangella anatolica TaxID=2670374 RepID=A0A2W2C289_9ACTN|nr:PQQ-dependent sugar dehydrogenase [Jiangella anatolica]PZF82047.1 glucose sorbosone dehydrogenase [Jiangella anatolica]